MYRVFCVYRSTSIYTVTNTMTLNRFSVLNDVLCFFTSSVFLRHDIFMFACSTQFFQLLLLSLFLCNHCCTCRIRRMDNCRIRRFLHRYALRMVCFLRFYFANDHHCSFFYSTAHKILRRMGAENFFIMKKANAMTSNGNANS